MKLFRNSVYGLLLICFGYSNAQQCENITDPSSLGQTSLSNMMGEMIPGIINRARDFPPVLNECFGSTDFSYLQEELFTLMGSKCWPLVNYAPMFTGYFTEWKQMQSPFEIIEYIQNIEEETAQKVCRITSSSVAPCIEDITAIAKNFLISKSTTGCCTPMFSKAKEMIGEEIDLFISKMFILLKDIACKARSPGIFNKKTETCFTTIAQTLLDEVDSLESLILAGIPRISALFSIPNNQACKAFTGKVFKNTNGDSEESLIDLTWDVCSENIDNMLTYVKNIPAINATKSELFKDGTYVSGETFIQSMMDPLENLAPEQKVQATAVMEALFGDLKIHLANGYSKKCKYLAKLKDLPPIEVSDP